MKPHLLLVILAAAIEPARGGSHGEFFAAIAAQVENGRISEAAALETLQASIDRAKKDLEAFDPPDSTALDHLLSSRQLDVTVTARISDGRTHGRTRHGALRLDG